jgi:hypothetical protein
MTLIERLKDQRDRDAAEHCPAEIIALQDETIAAFEAQQAENKQLREMYAGLKNMVDDGSIHERTYSAGIELERMNTELRAERDALQAENERLKADYLKIESLCDETYVAQGADAYNHACDEMERFQKQRRKAGKEVGTERSLCDGMGWLYRHVAEVEAARDALAAKLVLLTDEGMSHLAAITPRRSDETMHTYGVRVGRAVEAAHGIQAKGGQLRRL